jgi:hypothetical protein
MQIEQDESQRLGCPDYFHRLFKIDRLGDLHVVAKLLEMRRQHVDQEDVIIGDQDVHGPAKTARVMLAIP